MYEHNTMSEWPEDDGSGKPLPPVEPPEESEEEPTWEVGEGMIPINNKNGGALGQLKVVSVYIDDREGVVIEAEDVEIFGDLMISTVKINTIDLTYETLRKIMSLTEGPEI